jgi:hypothetical protein
MSMDQESVTTEPDPDEPIVEIELETYRELSLDDGLIEEMPDLIFLRCTSTGELFAIPPEGG